MTDMDINGIWRYFGNYSFFDSPFIWTTLHNMGGNDGMKGDMRMLQHLPGDAIAAGASIVGIGATPEGKYASSYAVMCHVYHRSSLSQSRRVVE